MKWIDLQSDSIFRILDDGFHFGPIFRDLWLRPGVGLSLCQNLGNFQGYVSFGEGNPLFLTEILIWFVQTSEKVFNRWPRRNLKDVKGNLKVGSTLLCTL